MKTWYSGKVSVEWPGGAGVAWETMGRGGWKGVGGGEGEKRIRVCGRDWWEWGREGGRAADWSSTFEIGGWSPGHGPGLDSVYHYYCITKDENRLQPGPKITTQTDNTHQVAAKPDKTSRHQVP